LKNILEMRKKIGRRVDRRIKGSGIVNEIRDGECDRLG
jgi:hypothetical protein